MKTMRTKIDSLVEAIQAYDGPPIRLMEVCGTHTHQLSRFGIPSLLPEKITLISGPGCPVCVTPAGFIDQAVALSLAPGSTVLSFGDMLRVPGNKASLLQAKADGGSVRLMYSPMDALALAKADPGRIFYVAAVGFETTLPLYALLIRRMLEENIQNIRLLTALKALMPALHWLCGNQQEIDGFIGPGHVSAILGYGGYEALCAKYGIPLAVAGFGYEHLIAALYDLIHQVSTGRHEAHNLYPTAVSREGNQEALSLIARFFSRESSIWRGLGRIEDSGYHLAGEYARFEAPFLEEDAAEPTGCLCGAVITGRARPVDCPFFGARCTPETPIGPCMVSSEGACGIWHATSRRR